MQEATVEWRAGAARVVCCHHAIVTRPSLSHPTCHHPSPPRCTQLATARPLPAPKPSPALKAATEVPSVMRPTRSNTPSRRHAPRPCPAMPHVHAPPCPMPTVMPHARRHALRRGEAHQQSAPTGQIRRGNAFPQGSGARQGSGRLGKAPGGSARLRPTRSENPDGKWVLPGTSPNTPDTHPHRINPYPKPKTLPFLAS